MVVETGIKHQNTATFKQVERPGRAGACRLGPRSPAPSPSLSPSSGPTSSLLSLLVALLHCSRIAAYCSISESHYYHKNRVNLVINLHFHLPLPDIFLYYLSYSYMINQLRDTGLHCGMEFTTYAFGPCLLTRQPSCRPLSFEIQPLSLNCSCQQPPVKQP